MIADALAFQDELDQVIAEPPPPWLRGPHLLAMLLLVSMFGISALLRTDIVVMGQGRLLTDSPPIILQSLERSVIREIRVRPGDAVRQGDVLVVLDSTFARADREALLIQQRRLQAEQARIEAELAGLPYPAGVRGADHALQALLHAQRQAQYNARLQGFDEQIGGLEVALRSAQDSAGTLAQQLSIAVDVERARSRLLEEQVGSRLQYWGARNQRLQAEREHRETLSRIAELRHQLQALQATRQGFADEWRRQVLEDSVRVIGERARVEEALAKASLVDSMTVLAAPADGIVLEVVRRAAGSVTREAEPLVSIIPDGVPLIAEIGIASSDVGHVRAGADVVLKVDAFPFQRHGHVSGTLRSLSLASFSQGAQGVPGEPEAPVAANGSGAFHRARVEITAQQLVDLPPGARLLPGMTLTAEVMAGTRSVLSYFLNPVLRGFREAAREP
ncbi:HlyD family type I secretion periplasmic adaptor subunit [Roseomonas stagni]|uniref:Membrane fusion protein (MFP) family protein n=1 Tax=Falsiroseomonas algicola TaxID=2716930 RepID=A0A6M1LTH0_9PROT|nr:HlyD family type I secretion periplasmic adaptor subunit [Falsiroseomonas algicola]NGM23765.1 HlyD family type I secretion periplasmic adaptor subunit [Falsiroseomonas algicola]